MLRSFVLAAGLAAAAAPSSAADWVTVSPILEERCIACHSGEFAPLGLQLDSFGGLIAGSENGPVVIPGDPGASPLIHRLLGRAEPRMPLDGPPFLDDDQIAAISAWIGNGAEGPAADTAGAAPAEPADPREDGIIVYSEVARIFGQRCIECHSDNGKYDTPPEGLRLDSYQAILSGGDRLVLIPGNAQASEIIRRVKGLGSPRMPFDGPPWLTDADIDLLRDWIDGGALSDDGAPAPVPAGARIRMRGIMTGPAQIDGADFVIDGSTRIDDRPRVGQGAEVRGLVMPDGRIRAERLRDR